MSAPKRVIIQYWDDVEKAKELAKHINNAATVLLLGDIIHEADKILCDGKEPETYYAEQGVHPNAITVNIVRNRLDGLKQLLNLWPAEDPGWILLVEIEEPDTDFFVVNKTNSLESINAYRTRVNWIELGANSPSIQFMCDLLLQQDKDDNYNFTVLRNRFGFPGHVVGLTKPAAEKTTTMREIKDVKELEPGKWYYLFDKRDNEFVGLEKLKWDGRTLLDGVPAAKFCGSIWTHEGNNQGMQRWHIFGPIEPPAPPTIEEVRLDCVS